MKGERTETLGDNIKPSVGDLSHLRELLSYSLLPRPKEISFGSGSAIFSGVITLAIPSYFSGRDLLVSSIGEFFREFLPADIRIVSGGTGGMLEAGELFLSIRLDRFPIRGPEFYRLKISADSRLELSSYTGAGIFRGAMTLLQILGLCRGFGGIIPEMEIVDWPDFYHRGFMLDISRDKVPKIKTLKYLIDLLALFKFNQLQLYTEHTFAYRGYSYVWENSSPITPGELLELQDYCRRRYIELVPNQNSFGHLHRWLKHPQLLDLAEVPEGIEHPFGRGKEPYSLCPTDERSIEFLDGLYSQLLPLFESRYFNIGFDETFDVGTGRSRDRVEASGFGTVYLEFFKKVYRLSKSYGKTPQLWADMVLKYPEVLSKIPDDTVLLVWGYEGEHPFEEQCGKIAKSGLPFYVCPGTSSWNSWAGRVENALLNLSNAALAGKKWGAEGYLITDWGDFGHQQAIFASFLGIMAGAAFSWNIGGYRDRVLREPWSNFLDRWIFGGDKLILGDGIFELGQLYKLPGGSVFNASPLFRLFILWEKYSPREYKGFDPDGVSELIERAEEIEGKISNESFEFRRWGGELKGQIVEDLIWVARLFQLAGEFVLERWRANDDLGAIPAEKRRELGDNLREILESYRESWLYWNRPGGLEDSICYLTDIFRALKL